MKNYKIAFIFFWILLLISCASFNKHIWVPAEPEKSLQKSDFAGIDVLLASFQVLNLSERDNLEDIRYLRRKFIRYINSKNHFRKILDFGQGVNLSDDNAYFTMEVVVTPDYTKYRTYILDIPFYYPFPFIWPITPVWGAANVNVEMNLFDRFGDRFKSISVSGKDNYWMIFYTYYRTAPMADAFRNAYEDAFYNAAEELSRNNREIVKYLDSLYAAKPNIFVNERSRKSKAKKESSIAILNLDAIGVSEVEAVALTNRLTSELFRSGVFAVVERNKMEDILKEQGFQMSGCTSSECLVEAGKLLSVELMLGGSVGKVGDYYSLELRIINVETASIEAVASVDLKGGFENIMTKGVKKAVSQLLAGN